MLLTKRILIVMGIVHGNIQPSRTHGPIFSTRHTVYMSFGVLAFCLLEAFPNIDCYIYQMSDESAQYKLDVHVLSNTLAYEIKCKVLDIHSVYYIVSVVSI